MAQEFETSIATRIIGRFLVTIFLVWILSTNLNQYFSLTGGLKGIIIIGALITLMNLFVRPIIHLFFAPFHFFFGFIATIAANYAFLWLTIRIAEKFDATLVTFNVLGGWIGFLLIAIILGIANWVMKQLLKF